MSEKWFQSEKMYQCTMMVARNLLKQGIISEKEYAKIDTIFIKKYQPSLGTLFSDIHLINLQNYGNI